MRLAHMPLMLLVTLGMTVLPHHSGAEDTTPRLSYGGKTALVTGSTDGLGRELALALAAQGAHVIVHGRNVERGQEVVDKVAAAGVGSARFYAADFASIKAVREFAETIARDYPRLDLLVNNAGIARTGEQPRLTSPDGHDLQFAVNYLAGWVLINSLAPNLAAVAPSRVINIASIAAQPIDFDDVMLERSGAHARGYGQSKLAPEFAARGITMISLRPATLMDTTMVESLGITPRTTVPEGRDHVMDLITRMELQPGAFYVEGKPAAPLDPQPLDARARARLVALSEELTGVPRQW
jgi:NAD(P)-dependent dehydrogenase (short-subunit alcohol dehydrogenase family)